MTASRRWTWRLPWPGSPIRQLQMTWTAPFWSDRCGGSQLLCSWGGSLFPPGNPPVPGTPSACFVPRSLGLLQGSNSPSTCHQSRDCLRHIGRLHGSAVLNRGKPLIGSARERARILEFGEFCLSGRLRRCTSDSAPPRFIRMAQRAASWCGSPAWS